MPINVQEAATIDVTVKPITWDGWKQLKHHVVSTLSDDQVKRAAAVILPMIQAGIQIGMSAATTRSAADVGREVLGGDSAFSEDSIISLLAGVVSLSDAIDKASDMIVEHCATLTDAKINDLTAAEVIELREACIRASDFGSLVELEKNCWGELASQLVPKSSGTISKQDDSPSPIRSGSQESTGLTDGDEETSETAMPVSS